MTSTLGDASGSVRARPIFACYLVATLAVAGTVALITFDVLGPEMDHFGQVSHRTHDVAYGLLFSTLVIGVLVQFRRPAANVAGMVMALIPPASLVMVGVLVGDLDAVFTFNPLRYAAAIAAVTALLHPAGRSFLRSFRLTRVDRTMLALVGIAAVPFLRLASTSIRDGNARSPTTTPSWATTASWPP